MPNFRTGGGASRRGAVVAVTALGLLVIAPQSAFAASVRVSPTTGLDPGGQTITVRGSGFDAARNNKFGVYVVFGPRGPDWASNSNAYLAATWVHPGGSGGGGQAPMSASGGFSVTLSVKARYTDGNGKKVVPEDAVLRHHDGRARRPRPKPGHLHTDQIQGLRLRLRLRGGLGLRLGRWRGLGRLAGAGRE